jgi:hypothetical protein
VIDRLSAATMLCPLKVWGFGESIVKGTIQVHTIHPDFVFPAAQVGTMQPRAMGAGHRRLEHAAQFEGAVLVACVVGDLLEPR